MLAGMDWYFWPIIVIGMLIFWGIPTWVASRTKPLGDKPYRWGMFIGIIMCILGTWLILTPYLVRNLSVFALTFSLIFGLPMILGGTGLIRRKKWGVVLFFVAWLMFMCMNPVLDSIKGTQTVNSLPTGSTLVVMMISALYFKNRWRLMG